MKTQKEYLDDVLNYILDSEEIDFRNNPSENHVYYSALVLFESKKIADDELEEALTRLGKS